MQQWSSQRDNKNKEPSNNGGNLCLGDSINPDLGSVVLCRVSVPGVTVPLNRASEVHAHELPCLVIFPIKNTLRSTGHRIIPDRVPHRYYLAQSESVQMVQYLDQLF